MDADYDCQTCGACCATFRVAFYWAEADDAPGGHVPVALTQELRPNVRCMRGTNAARPRCQALSGQVGGRVGCGIYALRPTPCRELMPGQPHCIQARRAHGMPVS